MVICGEEYFLLKDNYDLVLNRIRFFSKKQDPEIRARLEELIPEIVPENDPFHRYITIGELGIPPQVLTKLRGVRTTRDLLQYSPSELLMSPGIGPKYLADIVDSLAEHNLSLRPD